MFWVHGDVIEGEHERSAWDAQMFAEAFVIWERTKRPAPHRRCKYTVSLVMRVWSVPLLARSVAADTLREFLAAMLLTLIDSRVLDIQEGGNLMKARQPLPPPSTPQFLSIRFDSFL